MRRPSRPGFTLIELLTVIAIIGILAAVLIPAVMGVMRRSKQASSQAVFSGWCSGIIRYKQTYGYYPLIGLTATTAMPGDTCQRMEGTTGAVGSYLVMTLSGRNANGTSLTAANRTKYNRNGEAFVDFSPQDYEDYTKLPASTDTTGTLGTSNYLVDRFGNRNIRVVIDYDGNGSIRSAATSPTPAAAIPADVLGYSTTTGYQARVIIYTSRTEVTYLEGASAVTTTAGTINPDFLDVIAAQ